MPTLKNRPKYRNRKTKYNGMTFDSIREARRYRTLRALEDAGEISELRRQVKFVLIPAQRIAGKLVERECSYYADFCYVDANGKTVVEDAKGYRTDVFVIKRKLMLQRFGISVKEV